MKNNASLSLIHRGGGAIKATRSDEDYGWVEGYLVAWGDVADTDLQGEYFDENTNFCLEWFEERPVLYHHGLDNEAGLRKIGVIKSIKATDMGLWVEAQIDLRDEYASAVYDMVKSAEFGWSSGSVDHLVQISPEGRIMTWPIIEGSITPTPAQPAKTTVRAYKAAPYRYQLYRLGMTEPQTKDINAFKSILSQGDRNSRKFLSRLEKRLKFAGKSNNINPDDKRMLDQLRKEMTREDNVKMGRYRTRSRKRYRSNREDEHNRRFRSNRDDEMRRYRANDEDEMRRYRSEENELEAKLDEYATQMANEIEEELAVQAEEESLTKRAARSIRRRAMRRALRQIEDLDDTAANLDVENPSPGGTGSANPEYLGNTAKRYRSNRDEDEMRRYRANSRDEELRRYRANDELEDVRSEEEAILAEEIAEKSYMTGYRRGVRAAGDMLGRADDKNITEHNNEPDAKFYKRNEDEEMRNQDEFMKGYYAARNHLAKKLEEETRASDRDDRNKRYRTNSRDEEMRRYRSNDEDEMRRYRANSRDEELRRYRANDEDEYRAGDYEDEMRRYRANDEDEFGSSRSYRSMKSSVDSWKRRAMSSAGQEAPGQRRFSRMSVKDAADQDGAYKHAFKAYLSKGANFLSENERYILHAKGKVNWNSSGFTKSADGSYKTLYSGTDTSVGFGVPEDWVSELNKNVMTQTVMAPECRTRTTTSDSIVQTSIVTTDARRAHAAQVSWTGEGSSSADHRNTEDTYSQIRVPIHTMLISQPVSNRSLEDVTFDLESEITEAFSEAVAITYDQLIWSGDGQGKLQGIVTDQQVIGQASANMQTPGGYIPTGSADGIVTPDVFKKMLMHLPRNYRQNAKWYMNSNTGLELATLKDGSGNYLIDNRNEAISSVGAPTTLLNRPIVYNEYADNPDAGYVPVVFGDLSRAYLIGKRVDFSIRRLDDSRYAEQDEVLFLGRARVGGQTIQPAAMKVLKVAVS